MSGLVLNLWVLSLAILFQASNWHTRARSSDNVVVPLVQAGAESNGARGDSRDGDFPDGDFPDGDARDGHALDSDARDGDALDGDSRDRCARDRGEPADGTKELSAADDSSGNDVVPAGGPSWCKPPVSDCAYVRVDGRAPGGPPADAPFKPPRA